MTVPFDNPAYPVAEAARILGLPGATVKAWCFGQRYRAADGTPKAFRRVIDPADARGHLLSFANLCELHVLSAIRRRHRITLPKVRRSLDYLRQELGSNRPLLDAQFQTNGVDLFVEHASRLLNVTQQGQQALRGDFERALARIDRDARGAPIRLYPFTRTSRDDTARTVVVDPRFAFGRPILVASRVRTDVIQSRFLAGDSSAEMAADYGVEVAAIEEALRFEQRATA